MRALCGAIIAAGAFIGLGLTALGYGTRYGGLTTRHLNDQGQVVVDKNTISMSDTDRPIVYCLVVETIVGVIGLGIAFLGLMYHHYRRHHEFIRDHGRPPHTETLPFGRASP
ncbi:MAG TPA: hypothetical protein VFA18_20420 [Gemmataceae bacterium]|nr:hypothetical protein [Gemmataceae bacterium]